MTFTPEGPGGREPGRETPRRLPRRRARKWHAEPAKVADNLYLIGEKDHSSWALVGSDGIIVIEAPYHYAVADEVAGGLRKLGLDMSKVKYAVMSRAHGDHDGGAAYLQDAIPACVLSMARPSRTLSTNRPIVRAASRSTTRIVRARDCCGNQGRTREQGEA